MAYTYIYEMHIPGGAWGSDASSEEVLCVSRINGAECGLHFPVWAWVWVWVWVCVCIYVRVNERECVQVCEHVSLHSWRWERSPLPCMGVNVIVSVCACIRACKQERVCVSVWACVSALRALIVVSTSLYEGGCECGCVRVCARTCKRESVNMSARVRALMILTAVSISLYECGCGCECVRVCTRERERESVCACVNEWICVRTFTALDVCFHFPVVWCVRGRLWAYRYINVDICMEIYFLWVHAWREYDLSW